MLPLDPAHNLAMASTEREPLLASTSSQVLLAPTSLQILVAPAVPTQNRNQVSGAKLYWILGAIWIAVFLGALDGQNYSVSTYIVLISHRRYHRGDSPAANW